jgi:phospholipid N-methyltransferase
MLTLKESLKHYTTIELRKAFTNYNKSVKISGYSKLERSDLENLILLNASKFQHMILEKAPEEKKKMKKEKPKKEQKKEEKKEVIAMIKKEEKKEDFKLEKEKIIKRLDEIKMNETKKKSNKKVYGIIESLNKESQDFGAAVNYDNVKNIFPYYLFYTKKDFELAVDTIKFSESLSKRLKRKEIKIINDENEISKILSKIYESEEKIPKLNLELQSISRKDLFKSYDEPSGLGKKNKDIDIEPILEEKEKIIKVNKYSYDINYFNVLDKLASTTRGLKYKNEEELKIMKLLEQLQFQNDLYTTPKDCIETIMKFINESFKNEKVKCLEPSAGTGSIVRYLIDNNENIDLQRLDCVEYSSELHEVLKDKINIDNIYNGDFLYFKGNTKYNLIVMNPPFSGYVNQKEEPMVYYYHIIKAMLLPCDTEKLIYVICPKLEKNKAIKDRTLEFNINDTLTKRLNKFFNIDIDNEGLPYYQITNMGSCNGFIKYSKTGIIKMKQDFYIYQIVVSSTD